MANINTVNALGFRYQVFGVSNGSRVKLDSKIIGFAATPSANRQEVVLSPEDGEVSATTVTITVKSFVFMRTSGKVQLSITKPDNYAYVEEISSVYAISPAETLEITIQTLEDHNTSALIVWS